MKDIEFIAAIATLSRFAGFSLEKRQEWTQGPWRVRVLPNKATRQDYRIEVYGQTVQEVLIKAQELVELIAKE